MVCWSNFFFQAEDGIGDYDVTGVQTCALPIYHVPRHVRSRTTGRGSPVVEVGAAESTLDGRVLGRVENTGIPVVGGGAANFVGEGGHQGC